MFRPAPQDLTDSAFVVRCEQNAQVMASHGLPRLAPSREYVDARRRLGAACQVQACPYGIAANDVGLFDDTNTAGEAAGVTTSVATSAMTALRAWRTSWLTHVADHTTPLLLFPEAEWLASPLAHRPGARNPADVARDRVVELAWQELGWAPQARCVSAAGDELGKAWFERAQQRRRETVARDGAPPNWKYGVMEMSNLLVGLNHPAADTFSEQAMALCMFDLAPALMQWRLRALAALIERRCADDAVQEPVPGARCPHNEHDDTADASSA